MEKLGPKSEIIIGILKGNPEGIGPTAIGLKMGYEYAEASSKVMNTLKRLVKSGDIERVVLGRRSPVVYRIKKEK